MSYPETRQSRHQVVAHLRVGNNFNHHHVTFAEENAAIESPAKRDRLELHLAISPQTDDQPVAVG